MSLKEQEAGGAVRRILIIKTSSLGDIIHAYPAVEYIHSIYPNALIDWVVEAPNAELVTTHPYVNRAIIVSTKSWRRAFFSKRTFNALKQAQRELAQEEYDVVFDLQGNIKSGLILSQVRSRNKVGFGSATVPEWPNLLFTNRKYNPEPGKNIREDYLTLVQGYFGMGESPSNVEHLALKVSKEEVDQIHEVLKSPVLLGKMRVMVCPGTAWPNKQLTPETLSQFLLLLQKEYGSVFLFAWGSSGELDLVNKLQNGFKDSSIVIDRLKLPMLQNLMGQCDLVVAMDSLPLHLAGTTGTPTYSVFGASSAAKYNPLGTIHGALQGACPYDRTFEKRCPILRTCPTGACIHDLKAQEIFADFKKGFSR